MKFPVYVLIESDNVDRNAVTVAAGRILKKALYDFLSNAKFSKRVLQEFKDSATVSEASVQLLTEEMLIENLKNQNVSHV